MRLMRDGLTEYEIGVGIREGNWQVPSPGRIQPDLTGEAIINPKKKMSNLETTPPNLPGCTVALSAMASPQERVILPSSRRQRRVRRPAIDGQSQAGGMRRDRWWPAKRNRISPPFT